MAIADLLLAPCLAVALAGCQASSPLPRAAEVYATPTGTLRDECAAHRLALAGKLGGPSVVWLESPASPELERFYQEDNFYYVTGVEQPDIAVALRVDADGHLQDEVLFLPPHDANFEVWNGKRLSPGADAEAATGFRRTLPLDQRDALLAEWAPPVVHALATPKVALPAGCTVDGGKLGPALASLRLHKSEYEIGCLRAAIRITCEALQEATHVVHPAAYEYEAQAAIDGGFLRLGSERPGFMSILGSGPNSCALHYDKNDRQMQSGDLVVMDVGAKWRYYCADVTRTVPVNGHFTPRQRQVYELVRAAQTAAFKAAKPGMTIRDLDKIARQVIVDGGFGPDRKYFKHSVGHWIGLDVHDVGGSVPIEPGMCFTIEPGIYIDEEGLGVRIEDDYLMTADGAVKLSDGVTSDPDALEALMRG